MSILIFSAIVSAVIWLAWRKRERWIINTIGKRAYYRNRYVFMPSWRFARQVKFFWSGRKCASCGARQRLDVHHKAYTLMGFSVLYLEFLFPFMLQVLCRSCHIEEHD
jgi:hypothetical protein